MPSSRPCRRRISWQPAMTPWKSLATSKIAALQSVTCESSASRSRRHAAGGDRGVDALEQFDRRLHPDAPVAEQPALDAHASTARPFADSDERREQVEHDVVVVAGVERDAVGGAGLDHAAHHVERAVAVERRDLDGDDVLDRREAAPERHRQHEAADRRLQIEADQRDFARDRLRVRDQLVLARALHGGEREQPGVIAEVARDLGLAARPARCGRRAPRS